MKLFRLFSRAQSAPAARERLQVLLAHERASAGGTDLIARLRDDILRVISKHMQIDRDKVTVRMDRGEQVSTLAVDVEIPYNPAKPVPARRKAA